MGLVPQKYEKLYLITCTQASKNTKAFVSLLCSVITSGRNANMVPSELAAVL